MQDAHSASPTAMSQHRAVRLIGVCGASATGKTTMAARLAEVLQSPLRPICADWYFKRMRDFGPCRKYARCWELTSSVDSEGLAEDLRELSTALACAPAGALREELAFGHRAHGIRGVSRNSPANL
eukprot:4134555-Prymnesium_polylepis.1